MAAAWIKSIASTPGTIAGLVYFMPSLSLQFCLDTGNHKRFLHLLVAFVSHRCCEDKDREDGINDRSQALAICVVNRTQDDQRWPNVWFCIFHGSLLAERTAGAPDIPGAPA